MSKDSDRKFWNNESKKYSQQNPSKKKNTRLIARVINSVTFFVGVSLIFFPIAYEAQLLFLLVIPWLALFYAKSQPDYLRSFSFEESPYPGFNTTIGVAYCAILVAGILNYTIVDYSNAWWITIIFAPILIWLFIYLTGKEPGGYSVEKKMGKIILIGMYLILFSPYTFFATIAINCSFDYSEIVYTDAMVFDKYSEETDDYLTLYYADVELPDINRAATYVILPKKRWDDTVEGQQLKLGVRKGLLGIDWTWEQELKNNITLHFSVLDKNSTYPLIRSHAVITNSSFADTVYFDSKSIDFQLELENNYSVEFRSEGYQSKTILFNTRNVPVQDQTKDFPFELMKVSLIPQEGQYHNDTVAKFWYNTEVNDFYYEKTNGEN